MNNKIVRTICCFTQSPNEEIFNRLKELAIKLQNQGFEIQTKRICSPDKEKILEMDKKYAGQDMIFGLGSLKRREVLELLPKLKETIDTSFNYNLTDDEIILEDANVLFEVIKTCPAKTFAFTYTFNNPGDSPFFPSGNYEREGFSVGLQPTDLSEDCRSLEEWLQRMKDTWGEIMEIFKEDNDFLGIDSSIAPLFTGKSSLINFIKRLGLDFSHSATTDIYLKISKFIKEANPKPIGLCGLMFPCLEDFDLADEYEKGNFSIERNIYLSLHSGLGIDTYPIGADEKPERVLEILKLVRGLSNKYKKPLSARFVSDGKANIGDKTDFKNQYLKDVAVREL